MMSKQLIDFSNQFALSQGMEKGYTCTKCERKTDLKDSFSRRGKGLICKSCVGRMARAERMTISTWVRLHL